jgi:hypothetical protein
MCDEWLSNIAPSLLASCIFNIVVENWSPEVYVDSEWVDQVSWVFFEYEICWDK